MSEQTGPRSPLEPVAVSHAVALAAGEAWSVTVHPTAGSTNELAADRPTPGRVIVADHQVAGRGRLDRSWVTPPGTALTFSVVIDPGLPDERWPLIPLVAGVAVVDAVRRSGGDASVKWPNDVLLVDGVAEDGARSGAGRKLCGILSERVGDPPRAIVGIGVNVDLREDELPVPTATSLAIAGLDVPRADLLGAILAGFSARLDQVRSDVPGFLDDYRVRCSTLGRPVMVLMPDGGRLRGEATAVDATGCLMVEDGAGTHHVAAGDVVHVRPA
jgi:BirA family biotin operon repressor/biotin-[acetyl-CoA-carboxylase] ligase